MKIYEELNESPIIEKDGDYRNIHASKVIGLYFPSSLIITNQIVNPIFLFERKFLDFPKYRHVRFVTLIHFHLPLSFI